uniref:lysostaphin resistance A-like protein n=1 Tax=Flavobacterium sp. TaxID=239 RepID=UPI004049B045
MITFIKNQSPFVITIVTLGIIAIIMLLPTESLLGNFFSDTFKLEYVDRIFKMGLLLAIGSNCIRKLKIQTLAGLTTQFPWRFKYLNLIPAYLMIIAILGLSNQNLILIEPLNLILLLFGCLMVGFAEEYLFRGLLQSLFLKRYGLRKNGIFMSIFTTAVFFGAFHLINLVKNDHVGQVLVQVVFAMFIGFFFGVLVLKTNKLIPIAITHGLINFFFSIAFLPGLKTVEEDVVGVGIIVPIILTLPLFIVALFIYKKLDKNDIIKKIAIEN